MENKTPITVSVTVNAPIDKVWEMWNEPEHVTKWCFASDDWHAPSAKNDLRVGGSFVTKMAAKDGSFEFDFGGTYTEVKENEQINYTMDEVGRKVSVSFTSDGTQTTVTETFDPENQNPPERQREGWQAILNNFKKYVESKV